MPIDLFEIIALLLTLAALLAYLNHRLLKLPTSIGLMVLSLILSMGIIAAGHTIWPGLVDDAQQLLHRIDFNEALMHAMLGFLLFAGALHVDLGALWNAKWPVGILASVGVLISTFIMGGFAYAIVNLLGLDVPFIYCLLFGSLIAPTDPIAVLGILKTLGAPKSLETKIAGESLFNDGVGVVVFLAILSIAGLGTGHPTPPAVSTATSPAITHNNTSIAATETLTHDTQHASDSTDNHSDDHPVDAHTADSNITHIAKLFIVEAIGGALFGLAIGAIAFAMFKSIDNYQVEIMVSLALVAGGYALAQRLHVSGPIAMVCAGLLIGNRGRALAMSDTTREHLDTFWELIDEILNAVLFVLIGLEVLLLTYRASYLEAGLLAIPAALLARFIAVGLPLLVLKRFHEHTPHAVKVLTWGGLRGGISVALALSLRDSLGKQSPVAYDVILFMTYAVVAFSIIVQGLTIGKLLQRLGLTASPTDQPHHH